MSVEVMDHKKLLKDIAEVWEAYKVARKEEDDEWMKQAKDDLISLLDFSVEVVDIHTERYEDEQEDAEDL